MGQSLVGGLIGGAAGALQGFITGGPAKALALGAIGFVGGFASSFMAKKNTPEVPDGGGVSEPKFGGYTVNRRGAALHHQVIYGQTKVGGVVVFDDAHGTNNENLSRIIAYAGHEIEEFTKVYMGRYELTLSGDSVTSAQEIDENGAAVGSPTTQFNSYIKVRQVLGDHTTSLDGSFSGFSSEWTSNHKLLGIAHLAIVFTYADGVWDEGLPEVTALIKGKKVYDPRTTTTAWSDNPALIVRDFLTDTTYGMGESTDNIDDVRVGAAATVCEQSVTGGDRYTCNGAWTTSQAPVDVVQQLMTSCAGYLWYAQGQWRLKAGEYTAPTVTLTEADLRSPLSVATRHSRRDNFNTVRGTFRGAATNYQFTDYPAVSDASFVTVDGNEEATLDLTLPFTDTPEEAQRLAAIALEKQRSQITVTGSFGLGAFELQVGDNVNITNSRFGWTNKLFEVVAWSLSFEDYELLVNLVLRETTTTTYDEFLNTTGFESDNTNLPGALGEPASGGVQGGDDVTGLTAEGGVRTINATWSNPINDNFGFTRLYWNTSPSWNIGQYVDVVGESHSFTVAAGVTYYLLAQAYDDAGTPAALGSSFPSSGFISATSKTIETNDIDNNAVGSGQIANGAVDTTQLASGAVTQVASASTSGTLSITGTSYIQAQSRSMSGVEGNVVVQYSFVYDVDSQTIGTNDGEFDLQLRRGSSTTLQEITDLAMDFDDDRVAVAGAYIDTNPGTNPSYRLYLRRRSGTPNQKCSHRTIVCTELKR